MIGIDIIRIYCAIIVLLHHLGKQLKINFRGYRPWISSQIEYVMIMFFMISGFCLALSKNQDFSDSSKTITFYKKRILRIIPLYYAVELFRLLASIFIENKGLYRVRMLPVRLIPIQMYYPADIYAGGSWFIGCIMMCYVVYPLIATLFKNASQKIRILYCISVIFIYFYSIYLKQYHKDIAVYYVTFFRILQFSVGVVMPKQFTINGKDKELPNVWNIILFIALSLFVMNKDASNYPLYFLQLYSLPLILYFASKIQAPMVLNKICSYIGNYTFEIFLLQDIILYAPFKKWTMATITKNLMRFLFCVSLLAVLCVGWKLLSHIANKIIQKHRMAKQ